jgi:hypothetical protein
MQDLDAALFAEVDALIGSGKAADAIEAARILVAAGKVAGHGTAENKAQRLARRFREQQTVRIISQPGVDSASLTSMQTHATPPTAPDTAALLARIAALEAHAIEQDTMMAQLIERQCALIEAQEAGTETAERQAEAIERYVGATEMRLSGLGMPRLPTVRKQ